MAVRDGMVDLIRIVRGMAQVGTAEYTVAGTTWWSSEQIQELLDIHRTDLNSVYLTSVPEQDNAGSVHYYTYYSGYKYLEGTASGTVYFELEDARGSTLSSADYTPDCLYGSFRFANDTRGSAYRLRTRSYNPFAAAAQIWREKKGNVAAFYSFKSDNQEFKRSDWFAHCDAMVKDLEEKGGISTGIHSVQMVRTDLLRGDAWSSGASRRLHDGGIPTGEGS